MSKWTISSLIGIGLLVAIVAGTHFDVLQRQLQALTKTSWTSAAQQCEFDTDDARWICAQEGSLQRKGGTADLVGLARLALGGFLVFLITSLATYAIHRMHLVRSVQTDVKYRMRFAILAFLRVEQWLRSFRPDEAPPYLRVSRQVHHIFPSLQEYLLRCSWGNEIPAIRIFYRDFEEMEKRIGKIEDAYNKLVDSWANDKLKKVQTGRFFRSEIREHFRAITQSIRFWCERVGVHLVWYRLDGTLEVNRYELERLLYEEPDIVKIADALMYPPHLWYVIYFWGPFLVSSGFGVALFLITDAWSLMMLIGLTFLIIIVGWFVGANLVTRANNKVRDGILKDADERWPFFARQTKGPVITDRT